MTVQELIDELSKIKNKNVEIINDSTGLTIAEIGHPINQEDDQAYLYFDHTSKKTSMERNPLTAYSKNDNFSNEISLTEV